MAEFESLFFSTWDDFPWNGPYIFIIAFYGSMQTFTHISSWFLSDNNFISGSEVLLVVIGATALYRSITVV